MLRIHNSDNAIKPEQVLDGVINEERLSDRTRICEPSGLNDDTWCDKSGGSSRERERERY